MKTAIEPCHEFLSGWEESTFISRHEVQRHVPGATRQGELFAQLSLNSFPPDLVLTRNSPTRSPSR
jgi:hypothetical protein